MMEAHRTQHSYVRSAPHEWSSNTVFVVDMSGSMCEDDVMCLIQRGKFVTNVLLVSSVLGALPPAHVWVMTLNALSLLFLAAKDSW